jgi:hypothetical protein
MRAEFVAWAIVLVAAVYLFMAMRRFYAQGWFWTTFKFLTISFLYICFLAAPALVAVLALSVFGGSIG